MRIAAARVAEDNTRTSDVAAAASRRGILHNRTTPGIRDVYRSSVLKSHRRMRSRLPPRQRLDIVEALCFIAETIRIHPS